MKALKSALAERIHREAIYDKELSRKLRAGESFEFEGKRYIQTKVPTRPAKEVI